MKLIKLLVILFIISSNFIYSQTEEDFSYRIVSINTVGNKSVDKNTIIAYSGLVTGQTLVIPSDESRDVIKKLWNLGLFSDIQLYVEKTIGKDAYLVIKVTELPRVYEVNIKGNDEYSDKDIREKLNLTTGEVISEQRLKDIAYNLEKFYNDEGYSQAKVEVDYDKNSNNDARININISEGKKVTVRNINVKGNTGSLKKDDVKDAMQNTSEKVWWKFWDGARYDRVKFEEDLKYITEYLREKGYKDGYIKDYDVKIYNNGEDADITINVEAGDLFRINDIALDGNTIYNDTIILSRIDMKRGDVYDQKKLQMNLYGNESETDVSSLYLDNGYLAYNAEISEKVLPGNKVDLKIKITENNKFKFGLVNFDGNDKTQDKVLRRELYTYPGDSFNRANVKRSLQNLNALNYFNPERLTQDISLANDSVVNIKYIVEERSSDQFNASVGYSESFGITGALGLTFNNFDISAPFKGGAGQILNFSWQFGESGTYRTFNIGFTEPWLFNTPTALGVNLFDTRQNYSGIDIKETGGSLSLGRRLKWPDDFFRGDWTVRYQKTDTREGAGIYEVGIRDQVALRQTITRSTVFDPLFPLSGTKVSNTTELSGGPFLPGSIDYIKNTFSAETYTPLTRESKFVLYSNFYFAFINSLASDKYLPPNEVFYMGGNGLTYNTIALRGYDDRNVGPKNSAFNPIGGRVALKYAAELRYPLSLDPFPIFILAFAEAGNVWSEFAKTDPFDLRRSVGFGTRLFLPAVGLIGFDFGYGFDRQIVDRQPPKWLFHFSFGRGF
ncbi:MAG TPA: outer membrane protein assembly factor BamA [Bacteroidetes bacterium]|nr:outer membrane protein assembly factor BamA [Bacteroidota bacterium]HCN37118.1 outer membrane protein assembly factor BamA [Bacteroidota bacterium]